MCYVRTAPVIPTPSAATTTNSNDSKALPSFGFPDLTSLESITADTQWLNFDSDAILQSALTTSSAPADSNMDFMPWLESMGMPEPTFPSSDELLFSSFLPTLDAKMSEPTLVTKQVLPAAPAPVDFQKFVKSEPMQTPELLTVNPYLPSPVDSERTEVSAYPSLCAAPKPVQPPQPLPAAQIAPAIIMANSNTAPVSPPPSGGSSSDESSSAVSGRKVAAPRRRGGSSASNRSVAAATGGGGGRKNSNNGSRKRLASHDGEEDEDDDQETHGHNLDDATLKRMKNTEAARRSRARKLARLESLEAEVVTLEKEKSALMVRLAVLENEQANFAQREADLNTRIGQLEQQLSESHKAMILSLSR
ncbi:hypothetical protein HDU96_004554 [Phlyctochytrium bullatum]|nr:hypothetical protein HDU96_004554 [Phlyctochytrium bullatum]